MKQHVMTPLEYFATLVAQPDDGEEIPLTEAALAIAQDIEPLMIVVMGTIVGGMIISLYLPMFNIIKLIK